MKMLRLLALRSVATLPLALALLLSSCGGPSEAEKHYQAGAKLQRQGRVTAAISEYSRAIELSPTLVAAYLSRAIAYDRIGDSARAIADLDKAVQLDAGDARLHTNRGVIYMRLGQYQRAAEDFSEAIRLAPKDPVPYANRALAYTGLGMEAEAQVDVEAAVKRGFDANLLKADIEQARKRRGP